VRRHQLALSALAPLPQPVGRHRQVQARFLRPYQGRRGRALSASGLISGTVKHPTDAVVPNVTIHITRLGTNRQVTARGDAPRQLQLGLKFLW